MKKVALSLIALAVIGVGAFADAPKWDPKVTTGLTGEATLTLGYDLDTGVAALVNTSKATLTIDLISQGDAATKSDKDVWGEIKVKTDGDPQQLKGDGASVAVVATNTLKVQLDYAKIHFGKDAYLSISDHGTALSYTNYPDLAFWANKRSGLYGATATPIFSAALADRGVASAAGAEFGLTIPSVAAITLDAGTTDAWVAAGPNRSKTNVAAKGEVSLLFLPALTLAAGADYSSLSTADQSVGGKVGYKLSLGEKNYLKVYGAATFTKVAGAGDYLPVYLGGVIYALDGKSAAFDNYGLKFDKDWGSYPGVSLAGAQINKTLAGTAKDKLWINVSANSGALVADTSLVGAFEIVDLNADKTDSVLTVGASSKVVTGDVTISPKGTLNYESDAAALAGAGATYTYLQATADITGVIPFVTFTVNYASNDLSDKGNTVAGETKGKFEFTTKISF